MWNTRNPEKIALAYTEGTYVAGTQLVELMIAIGLSDSIWRNRDQFLKGHEEIIQFLTKKWCVHLHLAFDSRVSINLPLTGKKRRTTSYGKSSSHSPTIK